MTLTVRTRPPRYLGWIAALVICGLAATDCSTSAPPPLPPPPQTKQGQPRVSQTGNSPAASSSGTTDDKEHEGSPRPGEAAPSASGTGDEGNGREGGSSGQTVGRPEDQNSGGLRSEGDETRSPSGAPKPYGSEGESPGSGALPEDASGSGGVGSWSRESQEKVEELRDGLSVVDEILRGEEDASSEDASGRTRGGGMAGAGSGTESAGSGEGQRTAEGEASRGSGRDEDRSAESTGPGGSAGPQTRGQVPPDLDDGSNDDVVARQLRELAENETDPTLREAYWCDYRKYKGLTKDCPGADSVR